MAAELFYRINDSPIRHTMRTNNFPQTTQQSFAAATYQAVTIPTGVTAVEISPAPGYAGTIIQKGVTGDTGTYINPGRGPLSLDPAHLAFGFLCSADVVITFNWI